MKIWHFKGYSKREAQCRYKLAENPPHKENNLLKNYSFVVLNFGLKVTCMVWHKQIWYKGRRREEDRGQETIIADRNHECLYANVYCSVYIIYNILPLNMSALNNKSLAYTKLPKPVKPWWWSWTQFGVSSILSPK